MRAIVLPVRSLESSKSRLAEFLTPIERAALTLAMLEDVLDATTVMPGWDDVGPLARRGGARDRGDAAASAR